MKNRNSMMGFTLIELIVTTLIIGVLSAIAWPIYQKTIQKSNRAEAKSELSDAAQRLQRCYSAYGKFNDTTNCPAYTQVTATYSTQGRAFYTIAFDSVPTTTTFKLKATAILVPQMDDTGCEILKMDQNGVKTPAECW